MHGRICAHTYKHREHVSHHQRFHYLPVFTPPTIHYSTTATPLSRAPVHLPRRSRPLSAPPAPSLPEGDLDKVAIGPARPASGRRVDQIDVGHAAAGTENQRAGGGHDRNETPPGRRVGRVNNRQRRTYTHRFGEWVDEWMGGCGKKGMGRRLKEGQNCCKG